MITHVEVDVPPISLQREDRIMAYLLPRGANFMRAKFLWEIGLNIAGDPTTPYGGDRDMSICVGNGSGDRFATALQMRTGSPALAHQVAASSSDMAMVNPSAFLTQAYRGVGLFSRPLPLRVPLRVIAVYPSWDRFVFMVHPRHDIKSLAEIRERRLPLHVSVKEDVTHSTRVFIDQALSFYGFSLTDIEKWGGRLNLTGAPNDPRRMEALERGELDAIFDEGLIVWFEQALERDMRLVQLEPSHFEYLAKLGWRRATIVKDRYRGLKHSHDCIDYGGWPLYASASLPDALAFKAAASIVRRADQIIWETDYQSIGDLFHPTEATPRDVPLHNGVEQFLADHFHK